MPKEEIIRDIADVIGEVRPDTVAAHANATTMTLLAMEVASCIRPDSPYPLTA